MKVVLLTVCFLSACQICYCQKDTDLLVGMSNSYSFDRDSLIKKYSTMINQLSDTSKLPYFLFDECIEFRPSLIGGNHAIKSLRWEILQKVSSKEVIKRILASKDIRLKQFCAHGKKTKAQFINESFYDLLKKRYGELNLQR